MLKRLDRAVDRLAAREAQSRAGVVEKFSV